MSRRRHSPRPAGPLERAILAACMEDYRSSEAYGSRAARRDMVARWDRMLAGLITMLQTLTPRASTQYLVDARVLLAEWREAEEKLEQEAP